MKGVGTQEKSGLANIKIPSCPVYQNLHRATIHLTSWPEALYDGPMTVRDMQQSIGQKVYFVVGLMKVECIVEDARQSFQKPQFLIRPVAGLGSRWIEFSSIEPFPSPLSLKEWDRTDHYSQGMVRRP
jgi:hypothetical protein